VEDQASGSSSLPRDLPFEALIYARPAVTLAPAFCFLGDAAFQSATDHLCEASACAASCFSAWRIRSRVAQTPDGFPRAWRAGGDLEPSQLQLG